MSHLSDSTHAFNTHALWKQRFQHYMKESMGYWQYAARSNFIGFLLFLVIVSSYYYAKTLQRLPTDYPYLWIVLLVLVPLIASSSIRTLTRSADRMFLLRIEHEMGAYFRSSFLYSFSLQGIWLFLAWVTLSPLYKHCLGTESQPFLLMLALLLLLKVANLLASWQEGRFAAERTRVISVCFRWIATIALVTIQFHYSSLWASLAAIILVFVWLIAFRNVAKYVIGWDYLIAKEKQQQARLYAFFNWFVDVPQLPTRISRRGWISGLTRLIPFRQDSAFLYLYMKTLIRTELFAIVLRLTLIGVLAIAVADSTTARSVILLIALAISMVQLTSLERAHRYTFWLDMYPLEAQAKAGSLAYIIWLTLTLQLVILTIPFMIGTPILYLLVPLVSLALISFACGVVLRRKFKKNALLEAE
ncbi:ABC transporter permease [Paenibacillus qinlingensis]|uniref:ABC-2 type transport system permease protein n=1 Tax=Paenibacillus qinlingensis TaxID=1837343 RepID=A0ABU1P6F8_9BACL|nr:ABC transporter permease [Paenibacillus qinlingensis]MDR6555164.1 ABC-2 type transport system permease protein [Paenibacillus qinlingensis]